MLLPVSSLGQCSIHTGGAGSSVRPFFLLAEPLGFKIEPYTRLEVSDPGPLI